MACSIHSNSNNTLSSISAEQAPISCHPGIRNIHRVHLHSRHMHMHRTSPSTIPKLPRRRKCSVLRNIQISILNSSNILLWHRL